MRFNRCVASALQRFPPATIMVEHISAVEEQVSAMVAYVMSEARLFWLKPSEWLLLLVSAAICGFLTLLL
jgi:hypothetical protein